MTDVPCVVILTLERHQDGIWIRRLVEELDNLLSPPRSHNDMKTTVQPTKVEVRSLEGWMQQGVWVSRSGIFSAVAGIVNRVSDAAPPALFKACVALLTAARSLNIPVVNGPTSYSLCANKWCQHVLFQQAGLKSPPTKAYYNTLEHPANTEADRATTSEAILGGENIGSSVLVKPNSGGFGAGISKLESVPDDALPMFDDGITLLQLYSPPKNGKLYRVWFLDGRIQCAVQRTVREQDQESEFTGACAGSNCSIRSPSLEAFIIPDEVRKEVEEHLLPLVPDAFCGSVEYLSSAVNGERLYFDLNLLSTLPLRVSDPNGVWEDDYNPWKELATAILARIEEQTSTALRC